MSDNLPPLPETDWLLHMPAKPYEPEWTSSQEGYSSEDMQAYARVALAQAQSCVPAGLREEAAHLAPILSGMVEGGYADLETLYTDDQADGDAFVKRAAEVLAMLAASPQPQPVQPSETQWQKRHPLRTEGAWENTNEHDAKWWRDHSQGWEIRVLYAHPVAQAKPEQAAQPNPLARRCYLMSEAHLSGHRLIIGFERLEDLQDAHAFLAAPQPKD